MKAIVALALKDIKLIMRDPFGLFWLLAFPLIMALFFGSIFSTGSSSRAAMKVIAVDNDRTDFSKSFLAKLGKSDAINLVESNKDSARTLVRTGKAVAFLEIREGFSSFENVFSSDTAYLVTGMDPSRKTESGYLKGLLMYAWFGAMQEQYLNPSMARKQIQEYLPRIDSSAGLDPNQRGILKSFMGSLDTFMGELDSGALASSESSDTTAAAGGQNVMKGPRIEVESVARSGSYPASAWEITFPQSIIWALIGAATAFAVTIVTERTTGTLLRLRLAPISRGHILAGKGLACLITCVTVCVILLSIGKLIFDVRTPNPAALAAAILAAGVCFVGLMMLISVMGKSVNSVAGAGWVILLVMSMTGGGMVPLMAMPRWMATVGSFSPVKWTVLALEGAIWRGFSWVEMALPLSILTLIGVACFTAGVMIFRKTDA